METMALNYEYEVDVKGDSAGARVIAMAGTGKRILEIGAGPGSITRHLAKTNDVVALEVVPAYVERLRSICGRVISADLNTPAWVSALQEEKFDVLIAADVLEHLYDPWRVLQEMGGLLNENGAIVLSLPHTGHNAVIAGLLNSQFDYRDWGLLDRTHIRFFGIGNIQQLVENAGLSIVEAYFVMRGAHDTELAEGWRALDEGAKSFLQANRYGWVYQVVTKSVPRPRAHSSIQLAQMEPPRIKVSHNYPISFGKRLERRVRQIRNKFL